MEFCKMSSSILLLIFSLFISHSVAYTFYAGGKDGWVLHPSESYLAWASRNRFQVNDTIVFNYKQGEDSVLVVNQQDYDQCNLNNPIQKMENANSVFKFDRSGPFYFVSGTADRCKQGEKLIVVVLAVRPNVPVTPVSPVPSSSPVAPPVSFPVAPKSSPVSSPAPSSSSPVSSPSVSPVTISPKSSPVSSPVAPPMNSPTSSPVPSSSPVATPVTVPSSSPVATPVTVPSSSPVATPVTVPSSAPVATPVTVPSSAPVATTAISPVSSTPSPSSSPVAEGPSGESPANPPSHNGASEIRISAMAMGVAIVMFNYCFFN